MAPPKAPPVQPIDLAQISLRRNERALIVGGVESGKSTLADALRADFTNRYRRLKVRVLIVDTKPRYRAEFLANGLSAARRYKKWAHGPVIPGSVVADTPQQMLKAFDRGVTTVIIQSESSTDLDRLMQCIKAFLRTSKANRPQLAQIDETLDWFHSNGMPRGGDDSIIQLGRAGRERGTAVEYCAQGTIGLNRTLVSELKRLYALRLDNEDDVKRLRKMGAPEFPPPTEPHTFWYWTKDDFYRIWGPYKLSL